MISDGYHDPKTLERRAKEMEDWIKNPDLMEADVDAEYAAIIDISLDEITEPLLCCPNDPDDVKTLSEVAGDKVHETFVGSCMTNIGHFRAAGKLLEKYGEANTRLWIVPQQGWMSISLNKKVITKFLKTQKQELKSPAARYVWAIKPGQQTEQLWYQPLQGTSQIEWVMVAMSTWHLQR